MKSLDLFAGVHGGLMLLHHFHGWQSVGYVEMAEYPCNVLEARIHDGYLSQAPIFNMHTSEFIKWGLAHHYQGVADIVTAGFPCQPFSQAGKRQSSNDDRNGWPDTLRIIRIVRPRYVFLENVRGLLSAVDKVADEPVPYFGAILRDLAESGYSASWRVLSAAEMGAPHKRDRVWIVASDTHSAGDGEQYSITERWSDAEPAY